MSAPAPPPAPAPWQASRLSRLAGPVLLAAVFLLSMLGLATVGLPLGAPPAIGVIAAASAAVGGLITPALYLLAAFGLGRPLAALLARGSPNRLALQLALGVGAMLWLSHALGVLGLLSELGPLGPAGSRAAAWGVVALGLVLLAHQVIAGELRPERWPVFPLGSALWAPALGITAIAASNPAGGGLWESEFAAYDALSYHLQLAKEWAAGPAGRVWPGEHNVYSFLPSYVETAFTHLAALSLSRTGGGGAALRMLGEESHWVYACQWLHLGLGLIAAILLARLVSALARWAGYTPDIARFSGLAAGALFLGTPWTVVVGSLAYNELAMLAMMAGAMLAAADPALGPSRRGAIAGLLVGIACSAKPTALFLVGPAVGLMLVGFVREPGRFKPLAATVLAGSAAGLAAIVPWLVRNALASGGNPVFPFAAAAFGSGHWTPEQIARHARAHYASESLAGRVGLLFSDRGLLHDQWAYVPWMGLIALAIILFTRATHRTAAMLLLGLVFQIVAWMAFTHLQSRFLLPLLVPMSAAFGLAAATVLTLATRRLSAPAASGRPAGLPVLAATVLALLPLTAAGWSAINFTRQLNAQPNRSLILAAGGMSGMNFEASLLASSPEDQQTFLRDAASPAAFVNLAFRNPELEPALAPGSSDAGDLYLLGDATPLYYLDALGEPSRPGPNPRDQRAMKIHYHTTWDPSLLGDAIAAAPGDPAAWSAHLRARGIGYVLVSYSELARLIDKDRYYDPRVTLPDVIRWVRPGGEGGLTSLKQWTLPADATGRTQIVTVELFRINPPTPGGAARP